ncbi:uncharacterized protein [Littorina saxatilis]|uniref:Uncharacterized protein n=1 Tax=Littorina saxatilis TaxID=31220 RepID=A0AAN9BJV9_9CAEN
MSSARKLFYFERLKITLILLMLVCFETLSFNQRIFTCHPEAEQQPANSSPSRDNLKLENCRTPLLTARYNQSSQHDSLQFLDAEYQQHNICVAPSDENDNFSLHSDLKSTYISRAVITLPLMETLHTHDISISLKRQLNDEQRRLSHCALRLFQMKSSEKNKKIPKTKVEKSETLGCLQHPRAKESLHGTKEPSGQRVKWAVPAQCMENTSSDDCKEHGECQKPENQLPCNCLSPQAESMEYQRLHTSICSFHTETVALLNERIFYRDETLRKTKLTSSGRRCQRLGSRAWNVDVVPNPKGQAQRNSLKLQIPQEELSSVEQNGQGKSGNRSLVDLLLMSEHQRTGFSEAGGGSILMQLLVSLATIMLVLGDHSRQKKEQQIKYRLHLLLPRLGAYNRTARMNTDTHNKRINTEPCPLESFGRNAGHQNSQDEDNEVVAENARTSQSHESHSLKEKGRHFSDSESPGINIFQQTLAWVCPATAFLPSMTSADSNFLDHVGYRLASLAALPSSCSLSRVRLADAGFHFNPRTNRSAVVCHKCGAALSLDTSTQDATFTSPLAFHRQSSPRCPFLASVLDQFTEMPLGSATAQQEYDSSAVAARQPSCELSASSTQPTPVSFASRQVGGTNHADGRDLSEDSDGIFPAPTNSSRPATGYTLALSNTTTDRPSTGPQQSRQTPPAGRQVRDSAEERPHLDLGSAVYPQFSTAQSRLATFQNWPLLNVFLPQTLVSLGFYYAGYADCVRCFYCGVGLKSWDENDDPLVEHVRWRPQCVYLLATKGRQHIHSVINRTGNTGGHDDSEVQATTLPQRQQRQTAPTLNISRTGQAAVRDGPVARTGSDLSVIRQQLLVMGFSAEDIDRAQERLGSTGGSDDLDRLLATLIPE